MSPASAHTAAVVGGGPAGLACAAALARRGCRVLLVEASAPGGQLLEQQGVHLVPGVALPLDGVDLATVLLDAALDAGVELDMSRLVTARRAPAGWQLLTASQTETQALVVATGSHAAPLPVPGAADLAGRGVFSCVACDGPLFRGRPVAVVASGDAAVLEASRLADIAASVLVLLDRETSAMDLLLDRPNVSVRVGSAAEAIVGAGSVEAIRFRTSHGQVEEAAVDGVLAAVGRRPAQFELDGGQGPVSLPLPADGSMRVHGVPRLYAAGEARQGSDFSVVGAMSDGLRAAAALAADLESFLQL